MTRIYIAIFVLLIGLWGIATWRANEMLAPLAIEAYPAAVPPITRQRP